MLYQPIDPHRRHRIGVAVTLAFMLHAFFLLVIDKLGNLKLEREVKTVPVVIVADLSQESVRSLQSLQSASAQENARPYVTTTGQTDFSRLSGNKAGHSKASNTSQSKHEQTQHTQPTAIALPQQSQSSRAQQAREGLQQIFNRSGQIAPIEQRSTQPKAKKLSEYEISLIRILSRDTLYDDWHSRIDARNIETLSLDVELTLLPNGAIKRAKLINSSRFQEIDELAIRAVYEASPYPPPPPGDISKGYRYIVPIEYQPRDRTTP